MSNHIAIKPCKFTDVRTGDETLGVRVYDNYSQAYDNTWESIPDDDLEVLQKVMESDDERIAAIIDWVNENRPTIDIGSQYYSEDDYKHLFREKE